jgi:pimeloyl-ACP methyl ester carboxylesterase
MTHPTTILAAVAAIAAALALAGTLGLFLFTLYVRARVASLMPPKGRFVDVPDARLHIHDSGDGPPILMIHGLAGQLAHYTYGIAGRLDGEFRVVAVDRPGSGHSSRADDGCAGLSQQAAALAALIARLGLSQPLVVGHSLGGAVALTLALEHPGLVGGLALIAPLTRMQDEVPPVFAGLAVRSARLRRLLAWTVAVPASIRQSRAALGQVFGPETPPADFATRGGGLLGLRPEAYLSASLDLQALPDCLPPLQQRWHELRLPVSVLYGRDDRILSWQANGRGLVEQVPGARLELVDGGHMLPVTQPDVCAAFIRRAQADVAAGAQQGTGTAR